MTVGTLIEYLNKFNPNDRLSLIILNPKKRVRHIVDFAKLIVDADDPSMIVSTTSREGY